MQSIEEILAKRVVVEQNSFVIALYHCVSDTKLAHIDSLYACPSIKRFERHLDFLARNFNIVSLCCIEEHIRKCEPIPPYSACITFDDGLKEAATTILPILLRKGVPATFFITTDFIDNKAMFYRHKASLLISEIQSLKERRNLVSSINSALGTEMNDTTEVVHKILKIKHSDQQLLDRIADVVDVSFSNYLSESTPYLTAGDANDLLRRGFTIGSHTVNHPRFTDISRDEQIKQVWEGDCTLRSIVQTERWFAFPYSDRGVAREMIDSLHQSGMKLTFGTAGIETVCPGRHLQRICLDEVA